MPPFAGGDQRRAAKTVQAFQIGATGQRQAQNLDMAAGAGQQVRAVVYIVFGVHVGAGFDQQSRHPHMVGLSRDQQGGSPCRITGGQIRTRLQQAVGFSHIAFRCRSVQGLRRRRTCN